MARRRPRKRKRRRSVRRTSRRTSRPAPRPSPLPPGLPPEVQLLITPTIGTDGRVPKGAQPRPTEPAFLHIWMLLQDREFDSEEEMEALLSRYMMPGQEPQFPEPTEAWHKAQDLAYEGWRQESARERRQVARRALAISPDAVDAHLLLAHDAATWEEAAQLCTQAVTAGEHLLGPDPFAEYEDSFWGVAITRPYMRARFALGYTLWRQGAQIEAQLEFEDLLRINPGDNQGARYVLVALLLEQGKDAEARRIMHDYAPDTLSHWVYNEALLRFRQRGDDPRSRRRLKHAISLNSHVPELLPGKVQVPSWELESIQPGDQNEAVEYAHLYRHAWAMTPGALEWLAWGSVNSEQ